MDSEEELKGMGTELVVAETARLRTVARRMGLGSVPDMLKPACAAMAATAAAVAALDPIGLRGGA